MLISLEQLKKDYSLKIQSVLHIGAHECEELDIYFRVGVKSNDVIWLEANSKLVEKNVSKGIPNVYHAVVSDCIETVELHITNNMQSSSILDLEEHKREHPRVVVIDTQTVTTTTVEQLFQNTDIFTRFFPNFVNLDIQGAELKALKGFGNLLEKVDYIYTEVNTKHLYKNCALLDEMDDFLRLKGFERVVTKMTRHGWGDAFYIRKPQHESGIGIV
jgi:FkbM family methyltransferase